MKLEKIKVPNSHLMLLKIPKKQLDELSLSRNGDLIVNFQFIGGKYVPNISDDRPNTEIFGFSETIPDDDIDDSEVESPII